MIRSLLLAAAAAMLVNCGRSPAPTAPAARPPAKVQNGGVKEGDLATLILTEEAEKRLGIEIAQVTYGPAPDSKTFSGEVVLPPGRVISIPSPAAGTLAAGIALTPGSEVKKGDELFRLTPLVSAQRDLRVSIEAELEAAKTRVEAAKLRLARAEKMLRDDVGPVRAVEDAREELRLAETARSAAEHRLRQIESAPLDADVKLSIRSPISGIVRQVFAAPGQQTPAGAALVEVADLSEVWIKTAVYSGDLNSIVRDQPVRVLPVGAPGGSGWMAEPVPAPPTADPNAISVDLYFRLANAGPGLRPGQRVLVTFPGRKSVESLQAPYAAILYDIHGNAWVYENTAPHTFVRRRVEVARTAGPAAILARGPKPGTRVVTAGAAELFGTEFGPGK